ncbi:DNA-binding NarL/FixJ family response regulator [Micromonospora luteifusca]|uniref:DNA-binding NarL/FixJ family response regulator n=1 Tax=Micromonospora luteifusca TaxID=709860 RepID=A0ABS2LTH6_9ACTN|nr:response regulator transcription factor [Micromonospora luteifusca]MBM7491491.1 DNA-binding NarL/FixJ family response regulator [Micromonospora luteifusca]
MSAPTTVVVADDQELIRGAFAAILDAEPDLTVVAEAADGAEAVEAVRRHRPHLLVVDIRMPQMDGVEATRIVCAETDTRVLVLTTFDQDEYVYGALRAGASGFLLKDVRRAELLAAVRVVAAGESLLAPSVTTRLIDDVVRQRRPKPTETAALTQLSGREREILGLVGLGLSNAEIAGRLTLSEHTVKTHVSSVLSKLHLRDRVQAVVLAYESGLILPGE